MTYLIDCLIGSRGPPDVTELRAESDSGELGQSLATKTSLQPLTV